MNIRQATSQYERWLAEYIPLIIEDIQLKHQKMADDVFSFLRATFYRWAQIWPQVCPDLAGAPAVLAVGDLHIENFGTWRDAEGRLVWGVNDFDEACHLSYANDLVRLAASAQLAIQAHHLQINSTDACNAIVAGYTEGLAMNGQAFVLAERHDWLRDIAIGILKKPAPYWQKMDNLPSPSLPLPEGANAALKHSLPLPEMPYAIKRRSAGLGSLGRPRFVAVGEYKFGRIAREAKALVPSATMWASAAQSPAAYFYQTIVDQAIRCPDPFLQVQLPWVVRRLAPDCSRIELMGLADVATEAKLLHAMGKETANVHLGSKQAIPPVQTDLTQRASGWLQNAAEAMVLSLQSDWTDWKENRTML